MLEVFNTQFWGDIVWALLHSIWQAAVIALLLSVVLRRISAKQATLRYWLSVSAILGLVLITFCTYHVRDELRNLPVLVEAAQTPPQIDSPTVSGLPAVAVESAFSSPSDTTTSFHWTALAALLWVNGVSVMVLRTIVAVLRGNQLGSVTPIEDSQHLDLLTAQSHKLGLKRVPSFWSSLSSRTPYAVGVLAPAIVVPMSMLTSLTPLELQAVLAHELAHIRRNDYLANLFQMVIESVYFFNPALWWISRQVRVEREASCDQVAIETSSNKVGYATILANWMETVAGNTGVEFDEIPASGLAFADKKPSGMLERVQRILKPDSKPRFRVSPWNWVSVVVASLVIAYVLNAGSKAVTTAAVKALSDSQRVAAIEEKQDNVDQPEDGFEDGMAKISGHVITEDGGEVERGYIDSDSWNAATRTSTSSSAGNFKGDQDYTVSVKSGIVYLDFSSRNYAPAVVGPIKAFKDHSITQDVRLIKGVPHLIHVTDEVGQPISGAEVRMHPESLGGRFWKTSTDESGNYTFAHRNPGKKSDLYVEKYGYKTHRSVVTNDGRTNVTLIALPMSKGVVLSERGTPVANAEITITCVEDPPGRVNTRNQRLAATTDEMGRFETPMFSRTGLYGVFVTSDQGMTHLDGVIASEDLKFTLRPACSLDVTLKGDLNQLRRTKKGKLNIKFTQNVGRNYLWKSDFEKGDIEIIEDSDKLIRLKIKRLLPGAITLKSGTFIHSLEAEPGHHQIEVNVSAQSKKRDIAVAGEKVDLKVKFQCDGEFVKPGGMLENGPLYGSFSPLEDGELNVRVEPGKHFLKPAKLIGFTFQPQSIDVVPGKPNEVIIDVEPAGAVSGRIVDANGNPVSASVSCRYEIRRPPSFQSSGLNNHFRSDSEGNFLLTPIPLGAKVIVEAGERFNPAISQELLIEPANPVVEVKLQTAPPAKALVRVVDQQGNPIPEIDLAIRLLKPRSGSWAGSLATNAQGEAEISPLHPTWGYEVTAEPRRGFVKATVALVQGETNILRLEPGSVVRGRRTAK